MHMQTLLEREQEMVFGRAARTEHERRILQQSEVHISGCVGDFSMQVENMKHLQVPTSIRNCEYES